MPTHQAIINSSGRIVPVERLGKILIVYRQRTGYELPSTCPVSVYKYDKRFKLLPKT